MTYVLVAILLLLGGLIQGTSGFGAGLFCMALMPFFVDYKVALPVMFVATVALSLQILLKTYRWIRWRLLLVPILFSFLGRVIGQLVVNTFETTSLQVVLGLVICLTALFQLFWKKEIVVQETFLTAGSVGMVSGLMSSIAATGGPPMVLYLMNLKIDKYEYMATIQVIFLAGALFSIGLSGASGHYTREVLIYSAIGVVCVVIGSIIGLKLFDKLNRNKLMRLVNIFLLITSLTLILKTILG